LRQLLGRDFIINSEEAALGYTVLGGVVTIYFYNGLMNEIPGGLKQVALADLAITLAPASLAICTANVPTPPDAP
jgi:hypothetical protein